MLRDRASFSHHLQEYAAWRSSLSRSFFIYFTRTLSRIQHGNTLHFFCQTSPSSGFVGRLDLASIPSVMILFPSYPGFGAYSLKPLFP